MAGQGTTCVRREPYGPPAPAPVRCLCLLSASCRSSGYPCHSDAPRFLFTSPQCSVLRRPVSCCHVIARNMLSAGQSHNPIWTGALLLLWASFSSLRPPSGFLFSSCYFWGLSSGSSSRGGSLGTFPFAVYFVWTFLLAY